VLTSSAPNVIIAVSNKENSFERRTKTMTGLQKRRLKRKFRRFWKEWGITWEEFEMFLGAVGCIMFPLLLRIALAFFGI
jgi:hypothetical protein